MKDKPDNPGQYHILDASHLPAPEPLHAALKLLETMADTDTLEFIHRQEPCLLYGILEERGYEYQTRIAEKVHVIIQKKAP